MKPIRESARLDWGGASMRPRKTKAKKKSFIIRDWTGRELKDLGRFKDFETAWEFIRSRWPDDEETWGDLFVCDLTKGE